MGDSSSQQPSLTVLGGPMAGQRLVLDDAVANLLIGSDPSCDFYLPHESVSPIHARLWVDLEGTVLHETNSPHGLFVNDERVVGKHPLHNGDIVWLGAPGGPDSVMIQCVLPETEGAEEAAVEPAPDAAAAEREALESLAPTLAAGPAVADFTGPAPSAGAVPAWDEDDGSTILDGPAAAEPPAVEDADDDISRTQAFRLPADFAAGLAFPPPSAAAAPVEPSAAPMPAAPDRVEDIETLVGDTPEYVAESAILPEDHTLLDAPAYAHETPVAAPGAPPETEPEAYVTAEPEPEPEIMEPHIPEPEPEPTLLMSADQPGPAAAHGELPADFDDMMFSVPEEAPAPVPPPAAVAEPDLPAETVLLPAMPRPVVAPPATAAPAPPSPAPAPSRARAAAAPMAAAAAAPAARPARAAAPPASRPAPARPAARTATPTPAAPAAPSQGLPVALIGAAAALLVVAAGAGYWFFGRSAPTQSAANSAPPVTVPPTLVPVTTLAAAPEPVVDSTPEPTPEAVATVAPAEDVVTIVRSTPPPRPSAAPTAAATARPVATPRPDAVDPAAATRARLAAQVNAALGQAQSAVSARDYDAALVQYDEALKLDPQNAAAQAGKTSATAARAHARKAFVPGRTVVRTEKAGGGLAGFDSSGVNLQKAPDFQGRVEYAMSPASVQPGDRWELKIYIVNEGKKAIKISALDVATVVNGAPSGTGGAPKNREVAPQQRVIVDQLSGTWPAGVNSWRTEVKVTAGKNDSLQSQLTWR